MEGGEQGGGAQGHEPAAEHHQPHQQEVQQEGLGARAQVGQPVGGHPVDEDVGTVLRELPEDLQRAALASMWSQRLGLPLLYKRLETAPPSDAHRPSQ